MKIASRYENTIEYRFISAPFTFSCATIIIRKMSNKKGETSQDFPCRQRKTTHSTYQLCIRLQRLLQRLVDPQFDSRLCCPEVQNMPEKFNLIKYIIHIVRESSSLFHLKLFSEFFSLFFPNCIKHRTPNIKFSIESDCFSLTIQQSTISQGNFFFQLFF